MIIACEIDKALKKKGLRQIDLSKGMNVQPSVVTKWLSGTHNFTIDTLVEISTFLDYDIIQIK